MAAKVHNRIVLAGCFCQQALSIGVMYTFGMFTDYIRHDFGISNAQTSLVTSVAAALLYGAGPVALFLMKKFGCKRCCVAFAMLGSGSVIAASFTHNYIVFMILLGFVCGISCCATVYASYSVVPQIFSTQHERQVAYAISVTGVGIANVCFPPLITYFIAEYTWRQAFLMCGALMLHLVPASMLMPSQLSLSEQSQQVANNPHPPLWHNINFLVAMFASLGQASIGAAFFTFLSPFLLHNRMSGYQVGLIYLLLGAASLPGRFLIILFSRHIGSPPLLWAGLNAGSVVVQLVLYYYVEHWICVIVTCCAFGFLFGMSHSVFPAMVTFVVPDMHVHLALSVACFVFGVGGFAGPLVIGLLADFLGNYAVPLTILSGFLLFSVTVLAVCALCRGTRQNENSEENVQHADKEMSLSIASLSLL